jgi:hypothetical protein
MVRGAVVTRAVIGMPGAVVEQKVHELARIDGSLRRGFDIEHRVDAGLDPRQLREGLNVLDGDAQFLRIVGAEMSLQHEVQHQMQVRPDDGEDGLALEVVEVLDRRTRRDLERKLDAAPAIAIGTAGSGIYERKVSGIGVQPPSP